MMDPSELPPVGPLPPKGYEVIGEYAPARGNAPSVLQMRDLREKTKAEKQLKLYKPCSCGSGKKNKFCCATKEMVIINTGP